LLKIFEDRNKITVRLYRSRRASGNLASSTKAEFTDIAEDKRKLKQKTIGAQEKAAGLRDYVG
jgi:acyl-CoA hydrolase